ncbi:MAG: glycosyltransferase family 4 protein [Ilumatobacteraceae bacterium]|jgi:glycosyltransferase involved in cell wall biosynthesis|nr:glycosyltransferase family 4 protein [Actinomycetota bacterium]MDA3011669.1 glycosyltransferase family 4 protein [Actinomycetota bacterium]MDA3024476.1 glycosyltransferase family 4 protein [Actinomycetota bacterium]
MASVLDPDAPLRLAYLTYRGKPHVGGQGVYTRHLTKALVDLGHSVEVFGGQPYPVLDDRVPLTKLPSLDLVNDHYPFRLPAIWELKKREDWLELGLFLTGQFGEPTAFSARVKRHLASRTRDFDLVHDNQCLGRGILGVEKMIPTIVTLHHPITRDRALEMEHAPNWWKKLGVSRFYSFVKMQGRVASKMPRIVVVSENSIKDINADMGVSLDRMRLVPVGVDPQLFAPKPDVTRIPGRLITTASADVALKGLPYLLEAMAKLRTERDVTLTIIGKPKPGKSMDLIHKLGLEPHIQFVSGVPDERIVELYAEAELAVVPSLYEGFSLPAIEAMCTGICLVATDGGALPEVTGADGDTVLQCKAGDVEALASAVRRGLDDPELRARVGANGRQRVIDRWTWRRCAELTVEQYREVLSMPHNVEKLKRNGRLT